MSEMYLLISIVLILAYAFAVTYFYVLQNRKYKMCKKQVEEIKRKLKDVRIKINELSTLEHNTEIVNDKITTLIESSKAENGTEE